MSNILLNTANSFEQYHDGKTVPPCRRYNSRYSSDTDWNSRDACQSSCHRIISPRIDYPIVRLTSGRDRPDNRWHSSLLQRHLARNRFRIHTRARLGLDSRNDLQCAVASRRCRCPCVRFDHWRSRRAYLLGTHALLSDPKPCEEILRQRRLLRFSIVSSGVFANARNWSASNGDQYSKLYSTPTQVTNGLDK